MFTRYIEVLEVSFDFLDFRKTPGQIFTLGAKDYFRTQNCISQCLKSQKSLIIITVKQYYQLVNFKRTKIGGKCQKINSRMRHLGWFSLKKSHFAAIFKYFAMSQCSRRCINTTSGIFSRKNAWNAYHWDAGVHTVRFVVGYDRSKHQCQRNRRRYQSKVHHLRKWHNGNIIKDVTKRRRRK